MLNYMAFNYKSHLNQSDPLAGAELRVHLRFSNLSFATKKKVIVKIGSKLT